MHGFERSDATFTPVARRVKWPVNSHGKLLCAAPSPSNGLPSTCPPCLYPSGLPALGAPHHPFVHHASVRSGGLSALRSRRGNMPHAPAHPHVYNVSVQAIWRPWWQPWQSFVRTPFLRCTIHLFQRQCLVASGLVALVATVAIFCARPPLPSLCTIHDFKRPGGTFTPVAWRVKWPGNNNGNLLCAPLPCPEYLCSNGLAVPLAAAAKCCASSRSTNLPRPSGRDRRDNLAGRTRQTLEAEQQTLAH